MELTQSMINHIDGEQNIKLEDDFELLDLMIADSNSQAPIYRTGPYWAKKAKNAANEIKKFGISEFRGSTSLIGLSYADNLHIDSRNSYNHGLRLAIHWLMKFYPLSKLYDNQVKLTYAYANKSILQAQEILNIKERTKSLLNKYTIPYSLLGKCLKKFKIDGHTYSTLYLDLLEQHDNISSRINFNDAFSVFEIGGGFGINIHLLLENYKNIRKILYLDIPPNLYVGTQYLKAFYGPTAVFDYRDTKDLDSIKFSTDDSIEIFCITPWQIEKFESPVNIFINSNSFVEMPKNVVQNYADRFNEFPESTNAAIAMNTYDDFDINTTFNPSELPDFFKDRKFEYFEVERLLESSRKNLFFVSPGKYKY